MIQEDCRHGQHSESSRLVCWTVSESSPSKLAAWVFDDGGTSPACHSAFRDDVDDDGNDGNEFSRAFYELPLGAGLTEVASIGPLSNGWIAVLRSDRSMLAVNMFNGQVASQSSVSTEDNAIPGRRDADENVGYLLPTAGCAHFLHVQDAHGLVHAWLLDSSELQLNYLHRLPTLEGPGLHPAVIEHATWFANGIYVAVCASAFLMIVDVLLNDILLKMCQADVIGRGIGRRISCAGAKRDGTEIVSGSNNGCLIEWGAFGDFNGQCIHHQYHQQENFLPISDVRFTTLGYLVSMQIGDWNSWDVSDVRLWDLGTHPWPCTHHFPSSGFAVVTSQPCFLYSSAHSGAVRVWDLDTGSACASLVQDDAECIWDLQVSPCGSIVALASSPGDRIWLYNAETMKMIGCTRGDVCMFELACVSRSKFATT